MESITWTTARIIQSSENCADRPGDSSNHILNPVRMTSKRATGLRGAVKIAGGVPVPVYFKDDFVKQALDFEARPGDVFVATYPKSGASWLQYVVWSVYNLERLDDGVPNVYDVMCNIVPFIEMVGTAPVDGKPAPRCMKTHLRPEVIPYHPDAKYIVIVRNPFDCVVSLYHFYRSSDEPAFSTLTFESCFDAFVTGEVPFGSYFDHVLSWYERRHDPNVCFLYYEALKEDAASHILEIADFLDPTGAGRLLRSDPGLLAKVVDATSFQNLKVAAYEAKPRSEIVYVGSRKKYFRKGIVGDWRGQFNAEQEKRLRQVYEDRLAGTEMHAVWLKYLGPA